ncbi:hypothetical protein LOZ12_004446 [Ophidiomyces ophidiicola]|uniref:Uncharacterized protein n=1 Tax=Ophidiomyces ophidiicola TaxID=1387563 RepID=A0ACB8UT31_9EURO|nr:hypothetical protein LOZ64_002534 [Ophidiomyces ophidiicola]KAI1941457.1 hypothetical protein LOZ62_004743 [Ophidiomyces ophidiicola]KAI1953544.1 hypothetical protein LOZ59_005037 [Ophidiomyces ophidiicola]KAI1970096.1 hypothetical protein LOZ56_003929 [Ophidiomyces ophidiicola]KAI2032311.1 hypothetical protein LOZ45_001182 [Ophidiomyces ophidiicola]
MDSAVLPPLVTYRAVSQADRVAALRLIADSVAQQRQIAAKSLISHPVSVAAVILLISLVGQYTYQGGSLGDLAFFGTTGAGCLMIFLVFVQWMTSGYLEEAARVGTWKWLETETEDSSQSITRGHEDVFLVTKYGDDIIGTILLRFPLPIRPSSEDKAVLIRAWTVGRQYRQKGVGTNLLEEALLAKTARGADILFDNFHANSLRLLPNLFNRPFEKKEKWARARLEFLKRQRLKKQGTVS